MKRKLLMGAFERPSMTIVSYPEATKIQNTVVLNIHSHVCPLILDLVLKRNLYVTENRTLQLDYLVNDTTYPGLEGTVLLHFNVTILPVHIGFSNITHMFTLTRRASVYAQVLMTYKSITLFSSQS